MKLPACMPSRLNAIKLRLRVPNFIVFILKEPYLFNYYSRKAAKNLSFLKKIPWRANFFASLREA
jgi:hypothetical protein